MKKTHIKSAIRLVNLTSDCNLSYNGIQGGEYIILQLEVLAGSSNNLYLIEYVAKNDYILDKESD